MLQSNATKSGTGLAIYGDYEDLMGLYDVIHYLASALDEDNVAQKGRHQLLMNFAYEIRKAYSGDRLTDQERFNTENPEIPYYGFQLVWTDILVFLAVMRHTAGYIETDKLQQAVMCLLEQVVEKALLEYDVEGAHSIKQLIGQRINVSNPYSFIIYQGLHIKFISERTGKRRFRSIPDFIGGHFSEWRPEYKELIKSFEISANEQECKITDLEFSEFPEIKW
jgi:hypothetical protein